MLKLVNIVKNKDIIEADYIPENSGLKAHITYNSINHNYEADVLEEFGSMYSRMAANGLKRTLYELKSKKISVIPKERVVMWF